MESLERRMIDKKMELSVADFLLRLAKEEQLIADTWQAVVSELLVSECVQAKNITKWKSLPNDIRRMQIDHYENGSAYQAYSIVFPLSTEMSKDKQKQFFTSLIRSLLNKDRLQRKEVEQALKKMKNQRFLNTTNRDEAKITLIQSVEIIYREAAKLYAIANEFASTIS